MEFKLILKKLNNTLTQEEQHIFNSWISESKDHRNYFEQVKRAYSKSPESIDLEKAWQEVESKITSKRKGVLTLKRAVAAAVILAMISIPLYYMNQGDLNVVETPVVFQEKIEIGTDKATLTLEDGTKVALEEGASIQNKVLTGTGQKLVYNAQEAENEKEIKYNTLSIPRGGQFHIVLSDGSKVWLNSDSELKYPITFPKNAPRKVELVHGEAYFEVSPSTQHNGSHFLVATQGQEVDVVGTEFNVRAYKEDTFIETTLVNGKVLVKNGDAHETLAPGYQSKLDMVTKNIQIARADVNNVIAWKDGLFGFKDLPLKDIMTVLSRWYDIDVEVVNTEKGDITFNGVFNKKQDIQNILSIIENTNEVKFTTKGKTVLVE